MIISLFLFFKIMYIKLIKNNYKHHWFGCDKDYLVKKIKEQIHLLEIYYPAENCSDDTINRVVERCANISNYSMMIADNYLKRRYDINGKHK